MEPYHHLIAPGKAYLPSAVCQEHAYKCMLNELRLLEAKQSQVHH